MVRNSIFILFFASGRCTAFKPFQISRENGRDGRRGNSIIESLRLILDWSSMNLAYFFIKANESLLVVDQYLQWIINDYSSTDGDRLIFDILHTS